MGRFPFHSGVIVALLTGCASFYLYENPLRRWLNSQWRGKAQSRPQDASVAAPAEPAEVRAQVPAAALALAPARKKLR
jgi:peptidoglycan/LPS O-acetylase OafA/YrhL